MSNITFVGLGMKILMGELKGIACFVFRIPLF